MLPLFPRLHFLFPDPVSPTTEHFHLMHILLHISSYHLQGQRQDKSNDGETRGVKRLQRPRKGGSGAKYQRTILQSKQDGARHGLSSSECNKLFPVVQHFPLLPRPPPCAGVAFRASLLAEHTASQRNGIAAHGSSLLPPFLPRRGLKTDSR